MMKRLSIGVAFLTLCTAASARAQMEMPKPGPELKKLDYFAGTWNWVVDMKPGPLGPGGKSTMTEQCEWMQGGFFLVIHSTFKMPMGEGGGIAFMGYDPETKAYTYDEYNSFGEITHSRGSVEGDTWTYTSENKLGGQTVKQRFTLKMQSPTAYLFKFDVSTDGVTWVTSMDGSATKSI